MSKLLPKCQPEKWQEKDQKDQKDQNQDPGVLGPLELTPFNLTSLFPVALVSVANPKRVQIRNGKREKRNYGGS